MGRLVVPFSRNLLKATVIKTAWYGPKDYTGKKGYGWSAGKKSLQLVVKSRVESRSREEQYSQHMDSHTRSEGRGAQ